ncbi:hypothetical protein GDO81_011186, partial [Engystomops pustulosus]
KVFVAGSADGWKERIVFALLCWIFGMTISVCLVLVCVLSKVGLGLVNAMIVISLGMTVSAFALAFKSVRCTGLLFLLCCGMREGRNVLMAIGTSIVVFNNVKNILRNLKVLADSIVCNLEVKRAMLKVMPFDYYVKSLYTIYEHLRSHFFNPFKDFVKLTDNFQCGLQISDDNLKIALNQTKQQIQDLSYKISAQLDLLTFIGRRVFLLMGISIILIGAVIFLRKFLAPASTKYQNVYITKSFLKYDESRRHRNMSGVLPLNKTERNIYITIPSRKTSPKQKRKMVMFLIPVMTHISIWTLISILDFMLYWLIFTISKNLQGLHPVEVPITLTYAHKEVNLFNLRRSEDIYHNRLVINLFEPQCTPIPELSLSATWIPLAVLISVLLFLGLISAYLVQIKLLVIAAFYPDKDRERVTYLHDKIREERAILASPAESGKLKKIISQVR